MDTQNIRINGEVFSLQKTMHVTKQQFDKKGRIIEETHSEIPIPSNIFQALVDEDIVVKDLLSNGWKEVNPSEFEKKKILSQRVFTRKR